VRARRVAIAAGTLLLCSCSILTDFGELSGGSRGAGLLPDSGTDGRPIDPTSPEGGPAFEAGTIDAGFDGSGINPDTCPKATVALCETFDGDEKKNGWTVVAEGGASIAVKLVGNQLALVTSVPKRDSGPFPTAFWMKGFEQTVTRLSFDADMIYDRRTAAAPEYHILFQVKLQHPGDGFNLFYVTVPEGTTANGFALQAFNPASNGLEYKQVDILPGALHHVHWDVAVGGRSHFVLDGKQLVDIVTPAFVSAGKPTLLLGVTFSEVPTTPIELALDNVVFVAD